MKTFFIHSYKDGKILYEGVFHSFKQCLEAAVQDRAVLHHADLKTRNLSNANLDDALLRGADFTNANLSGTNLSESDLMGARFMNAALYNTCLAHSNLRECNFEGAAFGGTDIAGSDLSQAVFSTLSAFTLDFIHTNAMRGCRFRNCDGTFSVMNTPPVVMHGLLDRPLIFLDHDSKYGHETIDKAWPAGMRKWLKSFRKSPCDMKEWKAAQS